MVGIVYLRSHEEVWWPAGGILMIKLLPNPVTPYTMDDQTYFWKSQKRFSNKTDSAKLEYKYNVNNIQFLEKVTFFVQNLYMTQ